MFFAEPLKKSLKISVSETVVVRTIRIMELFQLLGLYQWWIQDFPEEGALTPKEGANLLFGQFFPKTA